MIFKHDFIEKILAVNEASFQETALHLFRFQANDLPIYKQYISLLKVDIERVNTIEQIPFLPISFFKTQHLLINSVKHLPILHTFESSGTTAENTSKHYVVDASIYEKSFLTAFQNQFGSINHYCILGLLPSYLERKNSSLVYMVNELIIQSKHSKSGFYLHNLDTLKETILYLEANQQPTLLFGVTFALLDFAEQFPMPLHYVKIIETGGMKGRREELTRNQIHLQLKNAFQLNEIYSEYGMTELFSQAYSTQYGIYKTPSWMKVLVRELNDPFSLSTVGKGGINIIDLANLTSCCFIATDDYGEVYENGEFTVDGRIENSEIRGCSLLTL